MNHETSLHLSDTKFKRLVGVERAVFNDMLVCLEQAQASLHKKGGRKLKIGMPYLWQPCSILKNTALMNKSQ